MLSERIMGLGFRVEGGGFGVQCTDATERRVGALCLGSPGVGNRQPKALNLVQGLGFRA